ncbi:hypothetical protein HU200_033674 [Digitaria exilis]|uniref:Uncharacterized protein n=1 Tax=Digitaria exilis TaxID=1010633 RepID=A0A835BKZ5_9POAL|nr:hypothetical protein HU200_033674 [Digitaria exilis]
MSFLLHCPWPFEQNFETFQWNDWPPLPLLMHRILKENSPQKHPLLHSQSDCEWSPFRCQRSSTYLGILPKASFPCCHLFIYQRCGDFLICCCFKHGLQLCKGRGTMRKRKVACTQAAIGC